MNSTLQYQQPIRSVLLLTLFLVLISAYGDEGKADRIFIGTNIITMDETTGSPELVAIRDDKIISVGQLSDLDRLSDASTIITQLGDRALLPGFIDAHGHFSGTATYASLVNLSSPPVGPVTGIASLQKELLVYLEKNVVEEGHWVFGYGYDDSLLEEKRHPDRHDLDQVSDTHPIGLIHVSGHLAATNSAGLAALNLTADTSDPAGGHIRREPQGMPNGVLEETAIQGVRGFLYQQHAGSPEGFRKALSIYAAEGTTTIQDGAMPGQFIKVLQDGAQVAPFPIDLVVYQLVTPEFPATDVSYSNKYHNGLRVGGVKLMLDGSPQGKTAYLTEPYHIPPHGQDAHYRGYPNLTDAQLNVIVKAFLDSGIPILAHANGDAAAEMLINAVDAGGAPPDHRTVMIHAQTLREDQLDRMARLGMIPSFFSAHTYFWGDWHRDSVLGTTRASRISPTQSAIQRGMPFTVHNDAPIIPPDIRRLIWATVNRITRSGKVLGADQRIATLDALKAVTINAAFQYFEEDRKGSITQGKQADLVILSANPLHIHPDRLKDLKVMETIARGKSVFKAGI